ncbi:MAG TPA: septum formation initiator family protein [Patescibacteria group bacterium]
MASPKKTDFKSNPLGVTKTVVWAVIIGYSLFLVGRSTYQNYSMNREISVQKKRVAELQRVKSLQELALIYYKSNAYREVEARRRLNLKGKDEFVVALPQASTEPRLTIASVASGDGGETALSPFQAWWNLLFVSEEE